MQRYAGRTESDALYSAASLASMHFACLCFHVCLANTARMRGRVIHRSG